MDGARLLQLFGDACTEICIFHDQDEGLLRAYQNVEFLQPVYAGDFLEIRAELVRVGRTSREVHLTAHKVISAARGQRGSFATCLDEPVLVCRATAICVVPPGCQRQNVGERIPASKS